MFPEEYREDPGRPGEAEKILYAQFARQLPDDFLVFHRRPWQIGSAPDGEAAFVIAHERLGILVLEVGRDPHDVLQQAERRRRSLARRLRELPRGAHRAWSVGHAAALLEADVEPTALVLGRRELPRLREWTEAAMAHWSDRERDPRPGSEGIEILVSLLALSFEIRPLLGQQIGRHEQELARLTIDQYRVLDGLGRLRRALICGCAGSGKTMLALEKVRRLSGLGYRTFYACYNRQLRESCARHLQGVPNATVDTFHGLCQKWARKAGVPVEEDESRDYWDRRLPEALLAAAKRVDDRFDAIVVDEGQDFKPGWWKPLQAALKDPRKGVLYIFYDDNQMLYTDELRFPPVDGQYDLSENCRNLRRIHELVVRFFKAERKTFSRASPGEKPEVTVYRTQDELLEAVEKAIVRLADDQKIATRNIVILTGHGKERSAVWRARRFAGFTLTDKPEVGEGEIFWSSVHAFKGLERAVVILAEIEPLSHAELGTLLYVGCSRARVHLTVILSEAAARLAKLDGTT
jgi:hypothetical protein